MKKQRKTVSIPRHQAHDAWDRWLLVGIKHFAPDEWAFVRSSAGLLIFAAGWEAAQRKADAP